MKRIKIMLMVTMFLFLLNAVLFAASDTVIVVSYAGDVKITPPDKAVFSACSPGMPIKQGTRIVTGEESYVKMAFDRAKNNIVVVAAQSDVIVKIDGDDRIELIEGRLFTQLQGMKRGEVFRVRTPDAVCGARGTAWVTDSGREGTRISVIDDNVFMRGINNDGTVMEEEFWVGEGFERNIKRGANPSNEEKMSERSLDGIRKEFGIRNLSPLDSGKLGDINRIHGKREEHMDRRMEKRDDEKREDKGRPEAEDRSGKVPNSERFLTRE